MTKEFFIIVRDGKYYEGWNDWRPQFSRYCNRAKKFETYQDAANLLTGTAPRNGKAYMPSGVYKIEKYFEVTDSQFDINK